MSKKTCGKCGRAYLKQLKRCPNCGGDQASENVKKGIAYAGKVAGAVASLKKSQVQRNLIRCPNCGFEGDPISITKGSTGIEVVLWLFLLIPGLIYGLWRLSSRYNGCPDCRFEHVAKIRQLVTK